jgi:hypothetical protein
MIHRIPLKAIDIPGGGLHLACGFTTPDFTGHVIIDTGASVSVFDESVLKPWISEQAHPDDSESISSGVNAMIEGQTIGKLSGVSLECLPLSKQSAGFMDMTHLRELYNEHFGLNVCGLIGSDLLNKYNAEIHYSSRLLVLYQG